MQKWPDHREMVSYDDIIAPIKFILDRGHYIHPIATIEEFDYDGFNIGKNELRIAASPKKRLSKEGLKQEKQEGKTLVDVLLNITFLLGMEQGRRSEQYNRASIKSIVESFDSYKRTISTLRYRNDELEALLKVKSFNPNASPEELAALAKKELLATRGNRMLLAKKDIDTDASKKPANKQPNSRASFKELKRAAKMVENKVPIDVWVEYLNECQWSLDDWTKKCIKEDFQPKFL